MFLLQFLTFGLPESLKCNCERQWNFAFLNVWVPALNVWKWPLYRISGHPNSLFSGFGFHKVLFGYGNYFVFQNIPPFFGYNLIVVLIKCLQFLSWHSSYPCSWKAHLFEFCGLFCRCPLFRSMYLGRHCRKCLIETRFASLFPKQWVSYSSRYSGTYCLVRTSSPCYTVPLFPGGNLLWRAVCSILLLTPRICWRHACASCLVYLLIFRTKSTL